jgi:hypothetical protein
MLAKSGNDFWSILKSPNVAFVKIIDPYDSAILGGSNAKWEGIYPTQTLQPYSNPSQWLGEGSKEAYYAHGDVASGTRLSITTWIKNNLLKGTAISPAKLENMYQSFKRIGDMCNAPFKGVVKVINDLTSRNIITTWNTDGTFEMPDAALLNQEFVDPLEQAITGRVTKYTYTSATAIDDDGRIGEFNDGQTTKIVNRMSLRVYLMRYGIELKKVSGNAYTLDALVPFDVRTTGKKNTFEFNAFNDIR